MALEAMEAEVAEALGPPDVLMALRRIGQPEDTAAAAVFLASDASSWLTGITLDVAGGRVMI
jgi:NAD(P)-dependent dehydrogenase (short-subunit alcohol dehydrogenase family)